MIAAGTAVAGERHTTAERPAGAPLSVRSFGISDRGNVRPTNEDQFLIGTLAKALQIQQSTLPQRKVQFGSERGHLFIVADGVGGNQGGEHASALAVDSIETFVLNTMKWFFHLHGQEADQVLREFRQAIGQADAQVCAQASQATDLYGMGTTVTMAYCLDNVLFVAHVGDSRAYLLRDGQLHRLTRDHTLVAEMVRGGILEPAEAEGHHLRNVITNTVGGHKAGVKVELHKAQLEPGDRLLLCTDGLSDMVAERELASILGSEASTQAACERLVVRANELGGKDNITAIVAAFDGASA